MKVDMVVMRHPNPGAAKFLSERIGAKVVNAGDGTHEHPSQALLDAFTIRKHLAHGENDLTGLHVANVRTSLQAMPDAYTDRWQPARRGQFARVWCVVQVPENCPHPKDKIFRGGFGKAPQVPKAPPKTCWIGGLYAQAQ